MISISRDNAWFVGGNGSNVTLSPTAGPGGRYLLPSGDLGYISLEPFTEDSAFVIVVHEGIPTTLEAYPVQGGPFVTLSTNASYLTELQVRPGRGSKVVFSDQS